MEKSNQEKETTDKDIKEEILKKRLVNHKLLSTKNYSQNIKIISETLPNAPHEITYGWFKSPYGSMLLSSTKNGICGLAFAGNFNKEEIKSNIFKYWPHANFHRDESFVSDYAASILENKYPLDIHMIGSPFQTSIWKALLKIPVGKVTTYSDIAYQIGNPSAVRAVATAIGAPQQGVLLNTAITSAIKTSKLPNQPRIAFLYLRGTSSIYLIGGEGSGADSLISAIGGIDVGAAVLPRPFNTMTAESLAMLNPDVIIVMTKGLESVGGISGLLKLPGVAQTEAGKNQAVIDVDDSLLLSFGPRTPSLVQVLAQKVSEVLK
mgnify:CR=1 FL=1